MLLGLLACYSHAGELRGLEDDAVRYDIMDDEVYGRCKRVSPFFLWAVPLEVAVST